jgi:hypothetical protein
MAKRAPDGDMAYSPLDMTLAQSVVKGVGTTQEGKTPPRERAGDGNADNPANSVQGALNGHVVGMPARQKQQSSPAIVEKRSLNREKRVLLTPEEERQIERLVDRIGEQLGTSLKLSHILRACMALLCHAEEEIIRHTAGLFPLARPANGDAVALAQFEQTLARLLSKSLRDAPALR